MEIKVYQIDPTKDIKRLKFMSFDFGKKKGGVDPAIYNRVYAGNIKRDTLEGVFTALNIDRSALEEPERYIGHSLSVSDIVEIVKENQSEFYYVDSIGFEQINFDSKKCTIPVPITKERIEEAVKNKQEHCEVCPRCGKNAMKPRLHTNALSRRADVYICDMCGIVEAIEDTPGNYRTPLEYWAISQTL